MGYFSSLFGGNNDKEIDAYAKLFISYVIANDKDVKRKMDEYAVSNGLGTKDRNKAECRAIDIIKGTPCDLMAINQSLGAMASNLGQIYLVKLSILSNCSHLTEKDLEKYSVEIFDGLIYNLPMNKNTADYLKKLLGSAFLSPKLNVQKYVSEIDRLRKIYKVTDEHQLPTYRMSEVNIMYKKGEILHYSCETNLVKLKKQTKSVGYAGPQFSFRICKGVRYRVGGANVHRTVTESWENDGNGIFWITNQRIGFIGDKTFSFPIDKIVSVNYEDGRLYLFKEGRQTPFIIYMPSDFVDLPCAIISELVNR